MRVDVDPAKCQGHTMCALAAPDIFELDDDEGHASVVESVRTNGVPAEDEGAVRDAVAGCPELAITITED